MRFFSTSLILFLCLIYILPAYPLDFQNPGGSGLLSPKATAFLETAIQFREKALDDYKEALKLYANSQVSTTFERFDGKFWTYTNAYLGWSSFFTLSFLTTFREDEGNPLLVFYNPICDIYLVTVWQWGTYAVQMTNADIIMGDWIRSGLDEPFSCWPLWQRGNMFKPAELGNAAAISILAFEKMIKENPGKDWPQPLPQAHSLAVQELNLSGIEILLFNFSRNIYEFLIPEEGEDSRLVSVRRQLNEAIDKAGDGDLSWVMSRASETPTQTRQVLEGLLQENTAFLPAPASLLIGKEEIFVFMAPIRHPGIVLSFLFKGDETSVSLKRIDLVDYRAFYEYRAENMSQPGSLIKPATKTPPRKAIRTAGRTGGGVMAAPKPKGRITLLVVLGLAVLTLIATILVVASRRSGGREKVFGLLDVYYSDGGEKRFPIKDKKISLGRDPSNDLVINDTQASGLHAEILFTPQGIVLKDAGSTNGTSVNGQLMTELTINFGDEIQIGDTRLVLRREG